MNRSMIIASLAVLLAVTPFVDGRDSDGRNSGTGGLNGRIQSLSNTIFSVGVRHRRRGSQAIVVHYNPETTKVTVDGQSVEFLDISAIGKYVSVSGTLKDNLFEATSITVTSSLPQKSKSKSKG